MKKKNIIDLLQSTGVCREHDQCTCYANWQGHDCADRTCPFAKSWGDAPYGHNAAHYYAECSSQGLCDRKTGECECFDGYEGDACRRLKCPGDCSGHGSCRSTAETASTTSIGDFFADSGTKLDKGVMAGAVSYGLWDAKKTRACVCDPMWGGIDCANMMCPRGDDPLTTEDANGVTEVYDIQTLRVKTAATDRDFATQTKSGTGVSAQGHFTLSFTDSFGKTWTTRPIPASDEADTEYAVLAADTYAQPTGQNTGTSSSDRVVQSGRVTTGAQTTQHHIRAALMALPNSVVNDVEVSMDKGTANEIEYRITFMGSGNSGSRNLLACNYLGCNKDGCQPRFVGILPALDAANVCTVKGATDFNFQTQSNMAAATSGQAGTAENVECSNRGLCDGSTGQCACFEGYTGEACSTQTILV
jgi:hypothetical protein